jgi:hypothetical protein
MSVNCNDAVEEFEIGRSCSTNGEEQVCILDIGGEFSMKETIRKTKTKDWVVWTEFVWFTIGTSGGIL